MSCVASVWRLVVQTHTLTTGSFGAEAAFGRTIRRAAGRLVSASRSLVAYSLR